MTGEILIKGGYGGRIEVERGQILEIVNEGGQQICDFFAFNAEDPDETLSPAHTRSALRRIVLEIGDRLFSRYRKPMFEIIEDTCGRHDITFPPCDPVVYEQRFGMHDHRSCRTNLAEAIADKNIPYAFLPEPINFFKNTPIMADGRIEHHTSLAKPGDKVVLRAEMDVIAAGSACPMEGGVNGDRLTDIRFVVRDA
jgi:uncharacterized protein YcgI (DUF1989 family)